jgi:hypothetical protein
MRDRGPTFTHRTLLFALAVLAFACGGLAVRLMVEHRRADCWRDLAQEGVAPEGTCGR